MIRRVLSVAFQGVRTRPGRSVLTMVSLFVGVLAVVIIQAGSGAVRDAYSAQAVLSSGNATTVKGAITPGSQAYERSHAACVALGNILEPVGGASALVCSRQFVVGRQALDVVLCNGNLQDVFPYPVRSGRWLSSEKVAPAEIVLNEAAARTLGAAPGSSIVISVWEDGQERSASAHVVGVVFDSQPVARGFMMLDPGSEWGISVLTADGATLYAFAPQMDEAALRRVFAVEYDRAFDTGPATEIQRSDKADDSSQFFSTVSLVFSAVAALSLLVGALGILNIGLATLKERSDELSLRRSFGATRREVMATIVAEGQIVALIAATVALGMGRAVFPMVIEWMSQGLLVSDIAFPVSAALLGVAASCAAALLGSLAPALRAGRVPIASIMRT